MNVYYLKVFNNVSCAGKPCVCVCVNTICVVYIEIPFTIELRRWGREAQIHLCSINMRTRYKSIVVRERKYRTDNYRLFASFIDETV